jgi:hypothetical protein
MVVDTFSGVHIGCALPAPWRGRSKAELLDGLTEIQGPRNAHHWDTGRGSVFVKREDMVGFEE